MCVCARVCARVRVCLCVQAIKVNMYKKEVCVSAFYIDTNAHTHTPKLYVMDIIVVHLNVEKSVLG